MLFMKTLRYAYFHLSNQLYEMLLYASGCQQACICKEIWEGREVKVCCCRTNIGSFLQYLFLLFLL